MGHAAKDVAHVRTRDAMERSELIARERRIGDLAERLACSAVGASTGHPIGSAKWSEVIFGAAAELIAVRDARARKAGG